MLQTKLARGFFYHHGVILSRKNIIHKSKSSRNKNMQPVDLDYSRVEANPPHPFIKVEEAAFEGVVFYVEQAATKPMP